MTMTSFEPRIIPKNAAVALSSMARFSAKLCSKP